MKQRCFLIDVEGVLVTDKSYHPVDGAVDWLNSLEERGIAWRLVSNNTTHRPDQLVAALAAQGFAVSGERLVGALTVAVALLQERGWRCVDWLGTGAVADWFAEQDLVVTRAEADPVDAVVMGVAPNLTTMDLDRTLRRLQRGTALLCLHRNRFWLDETGQARLGPGAIAAAFETAAPRIRIETAGKPEPAVYEQALKSLGGMAAEALFISDDPFTDLVGARRLGMATVFVLSGKYPRADVLASLPADQQPDLVLDRVDQLAKDAS